MGANVNGIEIMGTTDLLKAAMQCVTQLSIEQERERTERERIRAQAEVCIAKIRADLEAELTELNLEHQQRMTMIQTVCECCRNEHLTEREFLLCRDLLDVLKIDTASKKNVRQSRYALPDGIK